MAYYTATRIFKTYSNDYTRFFTLPLFDPKYDSAKQISQFK